MTDWWHADTGALVVSEAAMKRFAADWAEEFRWLSEN